MSARYAPRAVLAVLAPTTAERAYLLAARGFNAPLLTVDGDGSAYGSSGRTVALRAEERVVVVEDRGQSLIVRLDNALRRSSITLRIGGADRARLGPTDPDALTGWEEV
jgi:hypothetical protein